MANKTASRQPAGYSGVPDTLMQKDEMDCYPRAVVLGWIWKSEEVQ